MSKPCACGCSEKARPGRRFAIGHSFETAKLWRGKGKPDIRKTKNSTTVIYKDGQKVVAPEPYEAREPASVWNPQPQEWFQAEVVKCHAGNATFLKLSNRDQVYVHNTVFDYPLSHTRGLVVSVRIEPSDRGVNWRALEATADFDQDAEEVVVITKWNGRSGLGTRACGCFSLLFAREEIEIQHGETVIVSGFQSDGNPNHRTIATQIRKYGAEQ